MTHFLGSWCLANTVEVEARDRLLITLAGILPDFDGLGALVDPHIGEAPPQRGLCRGPHPCVQRMRFLPLGDAVLQEGVAVGTPRSSALSKAVLDPRGGSGGLRRSATLAHAGRTQGQWSRQHSARVQGRTRLWGAIDQRTA